MRLSIERNTRTAADAPGPAGDPGAPDLAALTGNLAEGLRSFFQTVERLTAANPVDAERLRALGAKAGGTLTDAETHEFRRLQMEAARQGRAIGAAIGLFLKFKPYPTLEEIRGKGKLFQPPFGPVLVVDGAAVRDVLERDQEFTVEPYGVEMRKVMTPGYNGGFSTFILSTDDDGVYEPDKRLLTAVCTRRDAGLITDIVHEDCVRRVRAAVRTARARGSNTIDIVQAVARYVPVTLGHRYLGVPVAAQPGAFELTPGMLTYYGAPIDAQPATALSKGDGVIPDEARMYAWIKAAFQHFFNNVQKDPVVQVEGLRACRQLLAYLLREVDIQRRRVLRDEAVEDTMLTRLVHFQLGRSSPGATRPPDLDPRLVSDLRIAENVMGTIVGAIAGQEEATCRVIDSLIRLQEGEYPRPANGRSGSFDEATQLARNVLSGARVEESRAELHKYFPEALRLQPQGEVLLRKCSRDGSRIAGGEPLRAGTLVFASHGWAMKDVPDRDAFILDRPREHYLQYGWGRHTCLGQYVSPVIVVETMIALLGLLDLRRPEPGPGEPSFPFERRFGRLQFDDQNLYATTFSLQFAERADTTRPGHESAADRG